MKHPIALIAAMLPIVVAQSAAASPMKRILIFGDSLSEGFMLQRGQAYAMLLVDKLRAALD